MSDDNPGIYNLISLSPGEPSVGIWYLNRDLIGQPVRLDADRIEWVATPPVVGGGPTRLRAGPYQYTRELHDEVFATNAPDSGQIWWLIPTNFLNNYFIATDPSCTRVWTAEEPKDPIKIRECTREPNQQFKFVPIFNPDE